jgi:hypothetical protein
MADTNRPISKMQTVDKNGNVVLNATDATEFLGSEAANLEIEASGTELNLIALEIFTPVADGTWYFTDGAGARIEGIPSLTRKGSTTYTGTYAFFRLPLVNGLKIVVASADAAVFSVFYSKK